MFDEKLSEGAMDSLLKSLYEDYNKSLTPEEVASVLLTDDSEYNKGYKDGYEAAINEMRVSLAEIEKKMIKGD